MPRVAIIGTREPDPDQHRLARDLAALLSAGYGCTVATGGALGIDQAAMEGAEPGCLVVYLPWPSYNRAIIPPHARCIVADVRIHAAWFESVNVYHPAPARLSRGARALHARNYGIVHSSDLVLAFPNETGGGGTGQGIRLAQGMGIPVIPVNRGQAPQETTQLAQNIFALLGMRKSA